MIVLRFKEWLVNQQYREDLIGDLAHVPRMITADGQFSRKRPNEHKNWVDIVIEIAEPGYTAVFNDAWREFLLAKQAEKDSQD